MDLPVLHFHFRSRSTARVWTLLAFMTGMGIANAATYPMPPEGQALIGKMQETRVQTGETLLDIARRYSVGFNELQNANPGIDPWLPPVGQKIVVPSQYLLPNAPREGIVVNLPELRLYYFPPAPPGTARVVQTFPLGIGSEGRVIPLGGTKIIEKRVDPVWVVPESIRAEHAAEGEFLPKRVPPGPDNPLGRYAMRLGISSYLIHSTNRPYSVGMRVSHGCLRMYPEHIEALYPQVALGTTVRIIDQPYKVGWHNGNLYLESHPPMVEAGHSPESNLTPMVAAVTSVVSQRLDDRAWQLASQVATQSAGIPVQIFTPEAAPIVAGSTAPAATSDPRWIVQVGVFRDPGKARQVAQLMRRMDLPLLASSRNGGGPCRVLVGPFPSREEAAVTGQKISKHAGLENLLVPAARAESHAACDAN